MPPTAETAASHTELEALRTALVAEKAARRRYAARLEEQAIEWMGQVGA